MNAWTSAQEWASKLPPETAWCFCITNEKGDAVFNIWADRTVWPSLVILLELGIADEHNKDSLTWYYEGYSLSLIQPEATHGPDEPAGTAGTYDPAEALDRGFTGFVLR